MPCTPFFGRPSENISQDLPRLLVTMSPQLTQLFILHSSCRAFIYPGRGEPQSVKDQNTLYTPAHVCSILPPSTFSQLSSPPEHPTSSGAREGDRCEESERAPQGRNRAWDMPTLHCSELSVQTTPETNWNQVPRGIWKIPRSLSKTWYTPELPSPEFPCLGLRTRL